MQDMIKFLMVARILYDKGYAEYAEAARVVKGKGKKAEFGLLGRIDEAYPRHVPLEVVQGDDAAGIIRYLGHTSDVRPYMQEADCIVLPSYHEGMSRVLMEALAMQKPIITSDIPGCRETVDDGKNGFLVPARDAQGLAQAFERFLALTDDERQAMGRYSRLKAEKEFDVNKVIAVYRSITG
jgi:glycosyltransferase involved in cell wall biosynthesis